MNITKRILLRIGLIKDPIYSSERRISKYLKGGMIPWSFGYNDYKWKSIQLAIRNNQLLSDFSKKNIPDNFGYALDERVVEYSWIFSNLNGNSNYILDAGSTFNFPEIITHPYLQKKEITITTYFPESYNFSDRRISYVYADLRDLPFKENLFENIICQSTLEHIGMDNSIYGYQENKEDNSQKDYSHLTAIKEYFRVLKPGGMLLITVPFGKYERHSFFQQFDREMIARIEDVFNEKGILETTVFKYSKSGWHISNFEDCKNEFSHNPHEGTGVGQDGAAHSRAICCLKFIKS